MCQDSGIVSSWKLPNTHLTEIGTCCRTFVLLLAFFCHMSRTPRNGVLGYSLSAVIRTWHLRGFLLSGAQTTAVLCYVCIFMTPIFLRMRWRQRWDRLAWGCRVIHEHKGEGGCKWGILLPWPHSQTPSCLAHSLPWSCLLRNLVPELFCWLLPSSLIFDVIHLYKASFNPLSPCGSHLAAKSFPSHVLLKYYYQSQ